MTKRDQTGDNRRGMDLQRKPRRTNRRSRSKEEKDGTKEEEEKEEERGETEKMEKPQCKTLHEKRSKWKVKTSKADVILTKQGNEDNKVNRQKTKQKYEQKEVQKHSLPMRVRAELYKNEQHGVKKASKQSETKS